MLGEAKVDRAFKPWGEKAKGEHNCRFLLLERKAQRPFSEEGSERAWGKGRKLKQGKSYSDIRRKVFTMRLVEPWVGVQRAGEPLILKIFKTQLDMALQLALFGAAGGSRHPFNLTLPSSIILLFLISCHISLTGLSMAFAEMCIARHCFLMHCFT